MREETKETGREKTKKYTRLYRLKFTLSQLSIDISIVLFQTNIYSLSFFSFFSFVTKRSVKINANGDQQDM